MGVIGLALGKDGPDHAHVLVGDGHYGLVIADSATQGGRAGLRLPPGSWI
jgi:hypothetical protein